MSDFTTVNNCVFDSYLTGTLSQDDQIQAFGNTQRPADWSDMRYVDRTLWAGPGRVIFSEARDYRHDDDSAYPSRAWRNDNYADWGVTKDYIDLRSHGIIHTIPSPFPGSANYSGIHDGTDVTKGFLAVHTLAKNAVVAVKVRTITIGALGGAIVSAWNPCYLTHGVVTGGGIPRYNWETQALPYPNGSEPGDQIELQILYQQNDTTYPAYLAGCMVYEPRLTTVA